MLDIKERLRHTMIEILNCTVSSSDIRNMTLPQIFDKYASVEQKVRSEELHKRYWDIILCREEIGFDFLNYDEPIKDAAKVLELWKGEYHIVYFTGRLELTREQTLAQLSEYGFPVDDTQLIMYQPEDYGQVPWAIGLERIGPILSNIRSRLFNLIVQQTSVQKVIDDFPNYFAIYKKHNIPELIGLAQSSLHQKQTFIEYGATKVVRSWSELIH